MPVTIRGGVPSLPSQPSEIRGHLVDLTDQGQACLVVELVPSGHSGRGQPAECLQRDPEVPLFTRPEIERIEPRRFHLGPTIMQGPDGGCDAKHRYAVMRDTVRA
jgi:hypothetical protein